MELKKKQSTFIALISILTFFCLNGMERAEIAPDEESLNQRLFSSIRGKEAAETVRSLIREGANVNGRELGTTPLIIAASLGLTEICALLIEHGAEIDATSQQGATALCLASLYGHITICALLIDKGANVNQRLALDPLSYATRGGQSAVFTLLVEKGANIHAPGVFAFAADQGNLTLCTLLLAQGAKARTEDLMQAAGGGHYDLCKMLIAHGVKVDERDKIQPHGELPLHRAASCGRTDICKLLLDNGASVNKPNYLINRHTALLEAAAHGHTDTCRVLLENKANVNDTDNNKNTPLHKAAYAGHIETCQLLIENNANVNARNGKNLTALFYATDEYRFEEKGRLNDDIAFLLVKNGALLVENNEERPPDLFWAIKSKLLKVSKLLIERGINVNQINEQGVTPLHVAAREGLEEICQLLLNEGADVSATNKTGQIALISGALRGHTKICKLLQRELIVKTLNDSINLTECRKRFKTLLLAFKQLLGGNYKNLGLLIFVSNAELKKEFLIMLYNAHHKGRTLDSTHKHLLKNWCGKSTPDIPLLLKPAQAIMKQAVEKYRTNKMLVTILHPNSLEEIMTAL